MGWNKLRLILSLPGGKKTKDWDGHWGEEGDCYLDCLFHLNTKTPLHLHLLTRQTFLQTVFFNIFVFCFVFDCAIKYVFFFCCWTRSYYLTFVEVEELTLQFRVWISSLIIRSGVDPTKLLFFVNAKFFCFLLLGWAIP